MLRDWRRSKSAVCQHCQGLDCAKRKIFHHWPNALQNVKIWKVTDTLPVLSLHTQTQPGQAANRTTTLAAFHQPPSSLGRANVTENNNCARHPRASEQQKWWQKEPLQRQKFNSKSEAQMEAPNIEELAADVGCATAAFLLCRLHVTTQKWHFLHLNREQETAAEE